jgi:hypothetical protein
MVRVEPGGGRQGRRRHPQVRVHEGEVLPRVQPLQNCRRVQAGAGPKESGQMPDASFKSCV